MPTTLTTASRPFADPPDPVTDVFFPCTEDGVEPDPQVALDNLRRWVNRTFYRARRNGQLRIDELDDLVDEVALQLCQQRMTKHDKVAARHGNVCCHEYQQEMQRILFPSLKTVIRRMDHTTSGKPRVDNDRAVSFYLHDWWEERKRLGRELTWGEKKALGKRASQRYREWEIKNKRTPGDEDPPWPASLHNVPKSIIGRAEIHIQYVLNPQEHSIDAAEGFTLPDESTNPASAAQEKEESIDTDGTLEDIEDFIRRMPSPDAPRVADLFRHTVIRSGTKTDLKNLGFTTAEITKLRPRVSEAIIRFARARRFDPLRFEVVFDEVFDEILSKDNEDVYGPRFIVLNEKEREELQRQAAAAKKMNCQSLLYRRIACILLADLEKTEAEAARELHEEEATVAQWMADFRVYRMESIPPLPPPPKPKRTRRSRPLSIRDPRLPQAGSTIARRHRGSTYFVMFQQNAGVTIEGPGGDVRSFKSVTGAANYLTGHSTNGYAFFNLGSYPSDNEKENPSDGKQRSSSAGERSRNVAPRG